LHVETIGMMTKYQLVFIKIEGQLNKLSEIFFMRYDFASLIQITLQLV